MSYYSPSKRRREGRNAFVPGADPMQFQPYRKGSWAYNHFLIDWITGWKEAEEDWIAKWKEEQEEGEQE